TQRDYELYGTYQPFSAALCHVLNHKSGMDHTTWSHTGAPVNIYAIGAGSDQFTGAFDNTEIFLKLSQLTNAQYGSVRPATQYSFFTFFSSCIQASRAPAHHRATRCRRGLSFFQARGAADASFFHTSVVCYRYHVASYFQDRNRKENPRYEVQ